MFLSKKVKNQPKPDYYTPGNVKKMIVNPTFGGVVYGALGSLCQTSCTPNLTRYYDCAKGKIYYKARRVIKKGDPLTIWSGFRTRDVIRLAYQKNIQDFKACKQFYLGYLFDWNCEKDCYKRDSAGGCKMPSKWVEYFNLYSPAKIQFDSQN